VTNDIDPERVGRATAEIADVDMRAIGEKDAIVAELTDAEKRVVAKASAIIAVNMLQDIDVLKDPPTVLDATGRQLKAVAAVWGVLARWDSSLNLDRRLGDQLKVLPEEDVRLIVAFLRWGGLVDDA